MSDFCVLKKKFIPMAFKIMVIKVFHSKNENSFKQFLKELPPVIVQRSTVCDSGNIANFLIISSFLQGE